MLEGSTDYQESEELKKLRKKLEDLKDKRTGYDTPQERELEAEIEKLMRQINELEWAENAKRREWQRERELKKRGTSKAEWEAEQERLRKKSVEEALNPKITEGGATMQVIEGYATKRREPIDLSKKGITEQERKERLTEIDKRVEELRLKLHGLKSTFREDIPDKKEQIKTIEAEIKGLLNDRYNIEQTIECRGTLDFNVNLDFKTGSGCAEPMRLYFDEEGKLKIQSLEGGKIVASDVKGYKFKHEDNDFRIVPEADLSSLYAVERGYEFLRGYVEVDEKGLPKKVFRAGFGSVRPTYYWQVNLKTDVPECIKRFFEDLRAKELQDKLKEIQDKLAILKKEAEAIEAENKSLKAKVDELELEKSKRIVNRLKQMIS